MFEFPLSQEAKKVFLAELEEQLEKSETLILQLEKFAAPETVQELFRLMHNIKGAAASIGYQEMSTLAHAVESALDAVRSRRRAVSSDLASTLMLALDHLKAFQNFLVGGQGGPPDTAAVVSKLEAFPESQDVSEAAEEVPSHSEQSGQSALKQKADPSAFSLGMTFSHAPELKNAPKLGRTIRVNVDFFDQLLNLTGELVTGKTRLMETAAKLTESEEPSPAAEELLNGTRSFGKIIGNLQEIVMKARLLPLETIFSKFPRMIRDLSLQAGKDIEFIVEGEATQLDRSVLEEIGDPLMHLLRNAVDHGIESPEIRRQSGKKETGTIRLKAARRENHVVIELEDDGGGISLDKVRDAAVNRGLMSPEKAKSCSEDELVGLLFVPGFSTAEKVSEMSGRGVGLDIVKQRIAKIGGSLSVKTVQSRGTVFNIRLPFSLAIVRALQVTAEGRTFAIPVSGVLEITRVASKEVRTLGQFEALNLRGGLVPLAWLGECYGNPFPPERSFYSVVIVSAQGRRVGLAVDAVVGHREFVVRMLGSYIGNLPGISGATVLTDGSVGLILDVGGFIQTLERMRGSDRVGPGLKVGEGERNAGTSENGKD